jgi:peptide/nickel transport system substrate-binding protein
VGVYVRKRDEFSESTGDKEAHVSDRSEKPGHDPREDGETRAVDQLVDEYVKKSIDRRQFFKRAGLLGVSIGGAAALLAACGGDDDAAAPAPAEPAPAEPAPAPADPEPAPADPEPAPADPEPAPPPPQPAADEPVVGGTLIEGYDRDFTKMDSILTNWADPAWVALYEHTVVRDPAGVMVPSLVDGWEVSEDLLTWTFTIRPGLTFHSGAPLTAESIAAAFNLQRDPATGQNAVFWPPGEEAVAIDDTTVAVTFESPNAAFPETLATEFSMIPNTILRAEVGDDFGAAVLDGSGPFTLANYAPGIEVLAERWDAYHGSNIPYVSNPGAAYLDAVQWVPILEAGQRANEIETGNAHVVKNPAGQDIERLASNGDLTTISFTQLSNFTLNLNHTKTQFGFDDVRVRQAISHAINRQAIADSLFFGAAEATPGPIASSWKWYEPGVEQFNAFDPDRSAALFDEAGWVMGGDGIREKDGNKLSFAVQSNVIAQPTIKGIDEAMVPMLADVGVEMKRNVSENVLLDAIAYIGDPEVQLDAYAWEWLWSAPIDVLLFFWNFPNLEFAFGQHPDSVAAFEKYQTAADLTVMEEAGRALQLTWAENLPQIPIVTLNNVYVHSNDVMNYTPLETMLYPLYHDVYLAT